MKKLKISGYDVATYALFIFALYKSEYMLAIGIAQFAVLAEIVDAVRSATGAGK